MNIKKLRIKATQVNIIEKMKSSQIIHNDMDQQIVDFILKLSASDKEQNELIEQFALLKSEKAALPEKETAFAKIKGFLMKHGTAIGDSVAAAALFEYLSKLIAG